MFSCIIKLSRITSYNVCYTKLLRGKIMDERIKTSGLLASKKALNLLYENKNISKNVYEKLVNLHDARNRSFDEFICYLKDTLNTSNDEKEKAVVAFSGGVDSTASTIIGNTIFEITGVSAYSPHIMSDETMHSISELSKKLKISHEFVPVDLENILKDTISAKYHPCGRCHGAVEAEVLNYAKKNGIKYVIYRITSYNVCYTKLLRKCPM